MAGAAFAAAARRGRRSARVAPGEVDRSTRSSNRGSPPSSEVKRSGRRVRSPGGPLSGRRSARAVAYANPDYLASAPRSDPDDPGSSRPPQGRVEVSDQWNFLAPRLRARRGRTCPERMAERAGSRRLPGGQGGHGRRPRHRHRLPEQGDKVRPRPRPAAGHKRFVSPKDFVDGDSLPLDEKGHGTHVASTIAQATDNGRGLTGVAYGAKLMPIRVLDRLRSQGTASNIAKGIATRWTHGADVINLSLEFEPVGQAVRADSACAQRWIRGGPRGRTWWRPPGTTTNRGVAYPARAGGRDRGRRDSPTAAVSPTTRTTGPAWISLPRAAGRTRQPGVTAEPDCDPEGAGVCDRQYSLNPESRRAGQLPKFGVTG